MKHLASAPVVTTLVIEEGTDLAFAFALSLLALVLALSLAFASCLRCFLGLLGLIDDVLLVAVCTALAVRTRLAVTDVEARKLRFLFGSRGERGSSGKSGGRRAVLVKLIKLFALLLLRSGSHTSP